MRTQREVAEDRRFLKRMGAFVLVLAVFGVMNGQAWMAAGLLLVTATMLGMVWHGERVAVVWGRLAHRARRRWLAVAHRTRGFST